MLRWDGLRWVETLALFYAKSKTYLLKWTYPRGQKQPSTQRVGSHSTPGSSPRLAQVCGQVAPQAWYTKPSSHIIARQKKVRERLVHWASDEFIQSAVEKDKQVSELIFWSTAFHLGNQESALQEEWKCLQCLRTVFWDDRDALQLSLMTNLNVDLAFLSWLATLKLHGLGGISFGWCRPISMQTVWPDIGLHAEVILIRLILVILGDPLFWGWLTLLTAKVIRAPVNDNSILVTDLSKVGYRLAHTFAVPTLVTSETSTVHTWIATFSRKWRYNVVKEVKKQCCQKSEDTM